MDIHDIPIGDIEIFLKENNKKLSINTEETYNIALELMKNDGTSYKDVPKSIIEWMMASNVIKRGEYVPKVTVDKIKNLSDQELDYLTKILYMKTENIESIINILKYSRKILPFNFQLEYQNVFEYIDNKEFLDSLEVELRHVNYNKIKQIETYNFKVGDRVFIKMDDNRYQFVVMSIKFHDMELRAVDVLGNIISDEVFLAFRNPFTYKWGIIEFYGELYPGILLFNFGPEIKNLNSPYLKYKSLPSNLYPRIPELNMTVTIYNYNERKNELYYIYKLADHFMTIESVEGLTNHIRLVKKDNGWQISKSDNENYRLENIGGFIDDLL